MKIVVIFARQRPRPGLKPIEFARQANRFRFRRWLSYARLQQHASNLICKCRSASIPDDLTRRARRALKRGVFASYSFSLESLTETGPFTVESRIIAGALPYSMRLCSSSQVLRALSQILASQLIRPWVADSTTKLDSYPLGTVSVTGPFCASAVSPVPLQVFPSSATEIGPFSV